MHRSTSLYWVGFKIVGDNIDKTVCPGHQTLDRQVQSLHYFHSFAIKDRISFSDLSDAKPDVNLAALPLKTFLLSEDDLEKLKQNYTVLVSRVLTSTYQYFHTSKGKFLIIFVINTIRR